MWLRVSSIKQNVKKWSQVARELGVRNTGLDYPANSVNGIDSSISMNGTPLNMG